MKKNNIIKLIGMSLLTIAIIVLCFTYPTQYRVNYKTGIQEISNGKFYDATISLAQASLDNYKNGKVLYDYATGQDDYSTGSQPSDVLDVMKAIPVNYNGELAEDIKTFTKKMEIAKADGDKGIETKETKKNAALIEALKKGVAEANSKPYNPEVGMSSSDVKVLPADLHRKTLLGWVSNPV